MEVISAVQRPVSRGQCRCASARTIAVYKSTRGFAIADGPRSALPLEILSAAAAAQLHEKLVPEIYNKSI